MGSIQYSCDNEEKEKITEYIWLVSQAEVTDIPPDIYNKIMNGIDFCDEDLKLIHELYVNRNKFITK